MPFSLQYGIFLEALYNFHCENGYRGARAIWLFEYTNLLKIIFNNNMVANYSHDRIPQCQLIAKTR